MNGTLRVVVVVAAMVARAASAQEPRSLYLIGGQSNATGLGMCADAWCDPQDDIDLYETRLEIEWGKLRPRIDGQYGPELTFGRHWADTHPEQAVAIYKYTRGGTSLCVDWAPPSGVQWQNFRFWYGQAKAKLGLLGFQAECRGMLWMQGEADAADGCAAEYESNLRVFIAAVRAFVGDPELPFVIGEVNDANWPTQGIIRNAQMSIAATDRMVGFVPTADLPFGPDGIHFNTEGQNTLGLRFAAELQRLHDLSPADIDGDGTVSIVDFLSVLSAWGDCSPESVCHADVDDNGSVGVTDFLRVLLEWG